MESPQEKKSQPKQERPAPPKPEVHVPTSLANGIVTDSMRLGMQIEKMPFWKAIPVALGFMVKTVGSLYGLAIRNHNLQVDILSELRREEIVEEASGKGAKE